MQSRGGSGGGVTESYSDDDGFQEEVVQSSDGDVTRESDDDVSAFEEGLDEGDAQYDDIDGGGPVDDPAGSEMDDQAYDAEVWEDAAVDEQQEQQWQRQQLSTPNTRIIVTIPPADVNRALSSNATSILTLAAFDVFLLSLM